MQPLPEPVSFDTPYGHYEVADTTYSGRPARVLYSGTRLAAQSGIAFDDKSDMLFDYNERFMELVRGLQPRRILLLGGGAFTLPKALQLAAPSAVLTIVELDGALFDVAKTYFGFVPSATTTVAIDDASKFLGSNHELYDLILVDVFTDATVPGGLQTGEFVQALADHLTPAGVVAMNLITSYYGARSALLRRLGALFGVAFPHLQLFPAGRAQPLQTPQNFVLTASLRPAHLKPYLRYGPLALPVITAPGI